MSEERRKWSRTAITAILLMVLGGIGVGVFGRFALENPLDRDRVIDYPQFSIEDSGGNYYVIDNSFRRILISDAEGNLIEEVHGGSREEGEFFYAEEIISVSSESFFVLNYVLDENGMFLRREEILEYSSNGQFERIFYQRSYDSRDAELVQRGRIFSPRIINNYLYFFLVNETGIQELRKSLLRETTEILGETELADASAYISDIEWVDNEHFFILDKRGFAMSGDIHGNLTQRRFDLTDLSARLPAVTSEEGESSPSEDSEVIEIAVAGYAPELPVIALWDLTVGNDGQAFASDLINRRVVRIDGDLVAGGVDDLLTLTSVLDRQLLSSQGYSDEPFIYYSIGSGANRLIVPYDYGIYVVDDGQVVKYFEKLRIPLSWNFLSLLWYVALLFLIAGGVIFLIYIYTRVMRRKVSLIIKQLLVIVPLMAGGIVLISSILLGSFMREYEENNVNKIRALTQTISQSINGDLFHSIVSVSDYMNDDYRTIRAQLRRSLNYNLDSWNEGLYFALYQVIDENLYGMMYLNNRIGLRHPFTWYEDPQSVYRSAYSGEIAFEQESDISGSWLYGIGPIYDSDNQVVALLEIGSDLYSFNQKGDSLYRQTMGLMSLIGSLIVLFITFMTFMILRSLRILRAGVERIADGDWDYQIPVRSNDEVSELGNRFNLMSRSINDYLRQIKVMNDSYQKFFPDQFLQYLDLQSLTEVKLGDQVKKRMTIMFSDIRSFTSISEQMTPEENFDFLNSYLNMVGPIIRTNRGFIDKYIGDAIMALFPDEVDDAFAASVAMLSALSGYNQQQAQRNRPPIQIGIGLHSGDLMLGILGEQQRMQGTVIADSVNFAARLETLSKQMGASFLTSGATMELLSHPETYLKRYMGKIQVYGRHEAVPVYEVLNGLPEEQIEAKLRSKSLLSDAIQAFETEDMKTAHALFQTLALEDANSRLSGLFIDCIEKYYAGREEAVKRGSAMPEWDGILRPEAK